VSLRRLLEFAMRHAGAVLALFGLLSLVGLWSAWRSPLDAIPDLSDPQVLLYAKVPGSPEQIAATVTRPVMERLKAIQGVEGVRGFSDLGYSYVTAKLADGSDKPAVRKAIEAEASKASQGGQAWKVAADASGVGWVFQYALRCPRGDQDLYDLRRLQEEVLAPAFGKLAGVAEVAPVGGYARRFEVVADPRLLEALGLKPADLSAGLKQAEGELRGRMIMLGERDLILGLTGTAPASPGLRGPQEDAAGSSGQAFVALQGPKDVSGLEALTITARGKHFTLGQLARVRQAPDLRRGIAELNGEGEVVGGIVIAQKGVNALELIGRVKAEITKLMPSLPAGVEIVPVYDRSELIRASLRTVRNELIQEILLVTLVVILFLGHWRSTLVLAIALPATIALHFIPLHLARLTMNLMTLGGLAIAIGDILDAGIILVENGNRALSDPGLDPAQRIQVLARASAVLIKPLFFTLVIVVVSFLPVFALEGQEGRLFLPLAASKSLSMLSALAVTLFMIPALCARYLKGDFKREEENPLMARLQAWYRPSLDKVLHKPAWGLGVSALLLVLTIPVFRGLPREFLPPLNEGSLLYMPVTIAGVPSGQLPSLLKEIDGRLLQAPEVERAFSKAGRAESATDPAPLSMIETNVLLKPRSQWRKGMDEAALIKDLDGRLQFLGLSNGWTQPIRGRIDMQATGIRTPLGLKVTASDLATAEQAAVSLEHTLAALPEVRSATAERAGRAPLVSVSVDLSAAAQAGLSAAQIQGQVLAQGGGAALAESAGVPVAVVYPPEFSDNLDKLRRFPIFTSKRGVLPLSRLAKVELGTGPDMINMENGRVLVPIYLDLATRDTMGWVARHQAALPPAASLGKDVRYEFSGQYESDQRAKRRLAWLVPLCVLCIAGLLGLAFGSLSEAALVLLSVPFALLGGLWIQALLGIPLSVSVWVGYIALFAVAVQTGVVMVVYLQEALNHRLAQGPVDEAALRQVVMDGSVLRLRPKLMTVATNVIGFVPLLWAKGAGSDLLASVAAPMVGGMLTSAVHVLYITPMLFQLTKGRALRAGKLKPSQNSEYL
jgi:Cu(I)/Ag(I) efflux system membrane protein CusA/SilA